jgi:hypothetical protein
VRFASRREEPPRLCSGSRGSALAVAAVLSLVWPRLPLAADLLDFPASSRFDIFDGDGAKVVGYASYDFRPVGPGSYVLHGENRFFDGQYDVEEDEVRRGGPDTPATPVTYRHDYFDVDGSLQRVAQANFITGDASCAIFDGHPQVNGARLEFPPDTYGGSTVLIPLTRGLREGLDRPIRFHNFNCIPGPRIVRIEAYPPSLARWRQYPGDLVHVRLKPDFGWLDFLIGPFVPKMDAWFEPARPWGYVGGKAGRYYKGPEIILVRAHGAAR